MSIKHNLKIAYGAISANKSRSFLTILGILIGITAVIMIMAIGGSAQSLILGEIGGLGAETLVVLPGREPTGPTDTVDVLFSDSLRARDVELLSRRSNVPDAVDVAPMVIVPGTASYEREVARPVILGGSVEFISSMFNIRPVEGVFFTEADIRQQSSVAVIGSKIRRDLFGESDALGKSIQIKSNRFRVVGVFEERGQVAFFNVDELIVVPHTTAQVYLLGTNYYHRIMVKASGPEVVDRAKVDIEKTLRESHGITDPSKDDFSVVTQQGLANQIGSVVSALTAFLSSVVAIALVVGGVGVMNIMLVSITERTREIGLRKAVGATNKDILQQFLVEAILLTVIGGIIGVILGALLSFLVSIVLSQLVISSWTFVFPISAVFLGLGVTALVGLVFGLYPARKAAEKEPTEALRYE